MKFEIELSSAAYKKLKKFDKRLKKSLVKEARSLAGNPDKSERLKGKYKDLWSLHFAIKGVAYRLIYWIDRRNKRVLIVWGGTRENLYKQLDRLKLKI